MKMKGKKRHYCIYMFFRRLLRHFFANKFKFIYDKINVPKSPFIVISNHLTSWDPLLIALSFTKHMYFVATDQIFRFGWKSKMLSYMFAPIERVKTVNETQTVIKIFKTLKENCNICMFAEGNSSFSGETNDILPSIGKLIKRAGVTLVTYCFSGTYFSLPRWGKTFRKGKTEGRLVQIYEPEQLAAMSETEIYETIKKDIYANTYNKQDKEPIAYRGKRRAEHLETALYCCPKCRQFATLTSCDDMLTCSCGYKVRYNEYCYFEIPDSKEEPIFKTITDWSRWQKTEIKKLVDTLKDTDSNTPIFTDDYQQLYEVEKERKLSFITEGKLCLYKDRISITDSSGKSVVFPISTIIEVAGFSMTRIIFSTSERKIFEIHCDHPRSSLKYLDIFKEIKQNSTC